ncbi:MAG: hypothetical protein RLW62_05455 [Gammaproteobacteria bacterium]
MPAQREEQENRRLHYELEHAIKSINCEQIGNATGELTKARFIEVARMVACLRARYLHRVLELGANCPETCIETEVALDLKRLREAYSEAMEGFSALEHALQRGYIQLRG